MKIGTKSILFGVHQFAIHPLIVAISWWRLYGFPCDYRLWVAFFVHDLGYFGKPNMDGKEGEQHPELGAKIMHRLFDSGNNWLATQEDTPSDLWESKPLRSCTYWWRFTRYHSRFLAKLDGQHFSPLCVADKLAIAYTPKFIYLIQANLSGEIHEYMGGISGRTDGRNKSQWQWLEDVQVYCKKWAFAHRDGNVDLWTGSKGDIGR